MTGSRQPDVTVRVHETAASAQVKFISHTWPTQPFRATLSRGALVEARAELDAQLLLLKDELPTLEAADLALGEIYDRLHRIGRRIIFTLFGMRQSLVYNLQEFWNAAVPFGRNPNWPPPYVECVGDIEAFLPIELLPLFSIAPRQSIIGRSDFHDACRDLVGFSCVVRRAALPAPLRSGIDINPDTDGRIRLRFLHYDKLEGAEEELGWFSSVAGHHVTIVGPYPTDSDDAPSLAEQIFDPRLSMDGGQSQTYDHVQHFACHCHAGLENPLGSEIELSGAGRTVRVSLGELGEDLVGMAVAGERDFDLPLIVMNACGSARMHAAGAVSFPYLFLQNGNRGFIGSEIEIPDDVAAEFSKAMYARLLLRQQSLGESVLAARNDLLRKFCNPLAITYSSYADPEIHVTGKDAHA